MDQPGYDALAQLYADTFPDAFTSPLERAAVDAFLDSLPGPRIVDVGCGIGHVAAHLAERGGTVVGVEPSPNMLALARAAHPRLDLRAGDARLAGLELGGFDGALARYSLIHLPPNEVRAVLRDWHARLPDGAALLIAVQSTDEPGVHPFDHVVAPSWRWHPDALAEAVTDAGFTEQWRLISRPDGQAHHRFPELHLAARKPTELL